MDLGTKIDLWLCDLSNYGCMSESEYKKLIDSINIELGDKFYDEYGALNLKKAASLSHDALEMVARRVRNLIESVRAEPQYNECLKAYQNNDHETLRFLIPNIFPEDIFPIGDFRGELFHGISVTETTTPESYVVLAQQIMAEGLRASPWNRYHSMDENIRPVYTVTKPESTYGLLFFSFRPQPRCTVFDPNFEYERCIFTPLLKVKLHLHLKPRNDMDSDSIEDFTSKDREKFWQGVEKELEKKDIYFDYLGHR